MKIGYPFSSLTASFTGEARFSPDPQCGDMGILELPLDAAFVINDGQHRRAAIEEALREDPMRGEDTISLVLFPFESLDRMQQMFSDLNRTARPTPKSLNILYDHRDLYARVVLDVVGAVGAFQNAVDRDRVSLPARSPRLFTLSALYDATRQLTGPVGPADLERATATAVEYWSRVSELIPEWGEVARKERTAREVRAEFVHTHAVAVWGIGDLGQAALGGDGDWRERITAVRDVDWRRTNQDWQGICMQNGDVVSRRQTRKKTAAYLKWKCALGPEPQREALA
jgi:DNA sulfur modification protein DndB